MGGGKEMKIIETFKGISGEICYGKQGRITSFIRLARCNLQCAWCDTKYSWGNEKAYEFKQDMIFNKNFKGADIPHILITGGEPLLQEDAVYALSVELINKGKEVTIETNGSLYFDAFLPLRNLSLVVDYKLNSSGMQNRMLDTYYFLSLRECDFVKMVVATKEDLEECIKLLKEDWENRKFIPAISPVIGWEKEVPPQDIIDVLIQHKLFDVVISAQIHKFLNLK